MRLQQLEAVRVDRPDEQGAELIEDLSSDNLGRPLGYPVPELSSGSLGEGESDDARGQLTNAQKVCNPLRNDLGLARTGRGDDLEVAPAVVYGGERFALELRCPCRARVGRHANNSRQRGERHGSA